MGQIAFVFSGQGDQFPGMGRSLCDRFPAAAAVYAACDRIRPGTSAQCFEGTEEELRETQNTQPCLFALELALASVLLESGISPQAAAGFSLGEVAAATVSGAFDLDTGFRLVCRRGALMQREAEKFETAMAAILRLTPETVQELCSRHPGIYPVNFNCPGQIAVSGLTAEMAAFSAAVKSAGGRVIPLKVSGAFHSPFMQEAARAFAGELAAVTVGKMERTLYSNVTARPYGEDVVGLLSEQICRPVQWEHLVRHMAADGVDTFIEIGPGRTLTNMIRKISPEVKAVTAADCLAELYGYGKDGHDLC